jgi:hypothetical protein
VCSDNCVGVLVKCVLVRVFIVFSIVCTSVRTTATERNSIAVVSSSGSSSKINIKSCSLYPWKRIQVLLG